MVEFQVGRGHDGPARVGELTMDDTTYETPLLTSFETESPQMIASSTLGRDEVSETPMLVSLPFISQIDEIDLGLLRPQDVYLLPSLASFGSLSSDAPEVILDYQLQIATRLSPKISPSQMILRIPPEISPESFSENAIRLLESGVLGAAFVFNGQLGPEDSGTFQLRSFLPLSMIAIALGRIAPGMIPALHYFGFDVMDINHGHEAALQNIRLWKTGTEKIETGKVPRYCSCPSCANIDDPENLFETLLNHNQETYRVALSESIHAMRMGQLRWLVEGSTHYNTALASLLRTIDKNLYTFVEEFTPTIGSNTLPLIGPESYNAPAIRRFRELVASRYTPSHGKQIVLLLPCSARKPYSDSKSSRRYRS